MKIRNGFYRLAGLPVQGEAELFFIANRLYAPSYVSLQSALSWHGLIPEGVFSTTSVTTLKTQSFQTPLGHFTWKKLKPALFFGFRLEAFGDYLCKVADPAKTLLDLLYLTPNLSDESHFAELRLNFFEVREKLVVADYEHYLTLFNSKSLNNRANSLLKYLSAHDAIV